MKSKHYAALYDEVSQMRSSFDTPYMMGMMRDRWLEKYKIFLVDGTGQTGMEFLCSHFSGDISQLVGAINLTAFNNLYGVFMQELNDIKDIGLNNFQLGSKNPSYTELAGLIQKIYEGWNNMSNLSDALLDHILMLKKAQGYLISYEKTFISFMTNIQMISLGITFGTKTEKENLIEYLLTDLTTVVSFLKNRQTELQTIVEGVIKTKVNMFQRADSALRMLVKAADAEQLFNKQQRDTTALGGGFAIEEV